MMLRAVAKMIAAGGTPDPKTVAFMLAEVSRQEEDD
jgi:hypothetical protein